MTRPVIHYEKPTGKYNFVQIHDAHDAAMFMDRQHISEGWLFEDDGRMFIAWRQKGQTLHERIGQTEKQKIKGKIAY